MRPPAGGAAFARFVIVGGAGFCVDAGLTLALIHAGMPAALARIPAIAVAMAVTWLANRRFTYRAKDRRNAAEALRYAAVALVVAGLNYVVYRLLISAGALPFASIVVATALQTGVSFFAYRHLVFRSA